MKQRLTRLIPGVLMGFILGELVGRTFLALMWAVVHRYTGLLGDLHLVSVEQFFDRQIEAWITIPFPVSTAFAGCVVACYEEFFPDAYRKNLSKWGSFVGAVFVTLYVLGIGSSAWEGHFVAGVFWIDVVAGAIVGTMVAHFIRYLRSKQQRSEQIGKDLLS